MSHKQAFNLVGINLVSRDVDEKLLSSANEKIPVTIEHSEIPGVVKAVDENPLGLFRKIDVTVGHGRTLYDDLARLPGRKFSSRFGDHP